MRVKSTLRPTAMNSDAAYTLVYQNRTMTELLLRAWLPPEVSELLEYSSIRSEPTKGYDEDGRQRTGDLLFSVSLKTGEPVSIAVMIELQSTCDSMMAWRMLSYGTLFWRRVEPDLRRLGGRLPALLSVVLYNGRAAWTASRDLTGCVALEKGSPLWGYTPNMRYVLVDVHRQNLAELERMKNPVGWAMVLELTQDPQIALQAAAGIDRWCQERQRGDVVDALRLLVRELAMAGRIGGAALELPPLSEEEKGMSLAENLESWISTSEARGVERGRKEGEALGFERGRREGEERGQREGYLRGQRDGVLLALELKFGALGVKFWEDHFARVQLGPWKELVGAIKEARSLDDLHRFRPAARP